MSLKNQTNKDYHIFIADLSEEKKKINTYDLPVTIIPSANKGYAHGVNIGIKKAVEMNIEQFCIINADTYVRKDFVKSVQDALDQHADSIIGGKIYYAAGYEYHKKYSKTELGKVIWFAGGKTDWKNVYSSHIGVDEVDKGQFDELSRTYFITGCFMAYNKNVYEKIGKWDESYFLYYEDADFCERAKKKQIELLYDPSIVLWHKNAQSTGGSGSSLHTKYQSMNRVRFGIRYAPIKTKLHLIFNFIISFGKK